MPQTFTLNMIYGSNVRSPMECSPYKSEDSNVEISAPTITFLALHCQTNVLLCPLHGIESSNPIVNVVLCTVMNGTRSFATT